MKSEEKVMVLLETLHRRGRIDSHDIELQERLGIGSKQLLRDLRSLAEHFEPVVESREGRRAVFRLLRPLDILSEIYRQDGDLGMLWQMATEGMPEVLEEFNRINELDSAKPYLFFNMPYEEIDLLEKSPVFVSLKNAIIRHEYRDIRLKGRRSRYFAAVKPIKLLFSEGNWYVAYIDGEELRLSRICFIDKVGYSSGRSHYSPDDAIPYLRWLQSNFQNGFSRYGRRRRRARLRAAPRIAHYFDEGMKRFFPSQRFIGKERDGSVIFEIDYSQEMEILPFLKRWLPDLEILSPDSLLQSYREDLHHALARIDDQREPKAL